MSGQITFCDALLDPKLATPEGLIDPKGRPAGKRFDVYRNNVVTSLIDAMITAFPVIHKLVGDEFFKAMTGVYVRANPPVNPLLMFYGGNFPNFLANFPPIAHLPYLPDIATLELERRVTYHAANTTTLSAENVAAALGDDPMSKKFIFAPATRLLSSSYPIKSLWDVNMQSPDAKIPAHGQCVLITRPQLDVEMTEISMDEYAFLSALQAGQTLEGAMSQVGEDFDLAPTLQTILTTEIITNIGN